MGTAQLIREFIAEAEEQLLTLEPNLLRLEQEPSNRDLINDIFLATHSMKGTAAYVGLAHISSFTHAIESLLEPLRTGRAQPSPEVIDLLLHGVDALKDLIARAALGQAAPDMSALVAQLSAWREELMQPALPPSPPPAPAPVPPESTQTRKLEPEECEIFADISRQQLELMRLTLEQIRASVQEDAAQEASVTTARRRDLMTVLGKAFRKIQSSAAMLQVDALDAVLAEQEGPFAALNEEKSGLTDEEVVSFMRVLQRLETIIADLETESRTAETLAPGSRIAVEMEVAPAAPLPLHGGGPPPGPAVEWSRGRYTLRVEAERVDDLLNLAGELVISRARLVQIGRDFKGLYEELRSGDLTVRQGSALQRKKDARRFKKLKERLDETTVELGRLTNQVQEATMRIRMVPISQVLSRFPRMVRDLARQAGKEVQILISGADTELDKTVIDVIGDPLIHLLRNAIDHGIEGPEERIRRGKARQGMIRLSAYYEGNQVILVVQDDGRGLDLERLKQKAAQQGLLDAREAENLSDREAMELIFASGLSTVDAVSSLSGRGVGLNVVKRSVEKISGAIELESLSGKGCTFLIKLPLTLAIIPALMVSVGAELFAIPLMAVEEAIRCRPQDLHTIEAQPVLQLRDRMIPVFDLAELLGIAEGGEAEDLEEEGYAAEGNDDAYYAVILSDGLREIGVGVDALFGEGDIVIKSLRHELLMVEGISGASIRGDGQVALVIDAASLINLAISRVKEQRRIRSEGKTLHREQTRRIGVLRRPRMGLREMTPQANL